MEWMKPRIKSMIWNVKKKKAFNQNSKKKKESKKQGQAKEPLEELQMYQHSNCRDAGRRSK